MLASVVIKLSGVDISSSIDWSSLQFTGVLTKEVSTLVFDIRQTPGKSVPILGEQIDMYVDGTYHYFGGSVTESETVIEGGILRKTTITATDGSFKADSKLVVHNYAMMDPQDIVVDIMTRYTTGFTTNHVQKGNFLVPSIKFNYEPVTKCLQKLANLIGWDWNFDAANDVHFFLTETNPAPFSIDDVAGNLEWATLDWDLNLQNMKNSVFVIGANYKKIFTAVTTRDVYLTNGTSTVVSLAYAYSKTTIHVTLNGAAQTIGIDQQDNPSSFDVMYNEQGRFIYFTSLPGGGETVKIFGEAQIPILAHASDNAAIAQFGEKQSSIVDKLITTVPEAQMRAKAEILLYGHSVNTVKFSTLKTGLFVGQQIKVNSTIFATGQLTLTIRRITASGFGPNQLEFNIEAYGSDKVTFVDVMSLLLRQENNTNEVLDSTVLEALVISPETLILAETITATASAAPYHWGHTVNPKKRWGFSKWGY